MSGKERLVISHVLQGTDALSRVNFEHSIDEKEWMAVRKVAEDRTDVQAERISHGRHPAQWSIGSVGAAYCGNIVMELQQIRAQLSKENAGIQA
jgi:hypothetical protein